MVDTKPSINRFFKDWADDLNYGWMLFFVHGGFKRSCFLVLKESLESLLFVIFFTLFFYLVKNVQINLSQLHSLMDLLELITCVLFFQQAGLAIVYGIRFNKGRLIKLRGFLPISDYAILIAESIRVSWLFLVALAIVFIVQVIILGFEFSSVGSFIAVMFFSLASFVFFLFCGYTVKDRIGNAEVACKYLPQIFVLTSPVFINFEFLEKYSPFGYSWLWISSILNYRIMALDKLIVMGMFFQLLPFFLMKNR